VARKEWRKPEVKSLKAGAAEHLAAGKVDGGGAGAKS
jgi:hypothetical protein